VTTIAPELAASLQRDREPGHAAPSIPAAYSAAAKAKLNRDRDAYKAFRAVDQKLWDVDHERRMAKAVALAEEDVAAWRLDVETFGPEAAEARAAHRAAEDRARDAREYARSLEAEARKAREDGTAEEATGAQVRADTADGVAAEREAAAAEALQAMEGLERDLGESREGLEQAQARLRAARKAARTPAGTAPISNTTITMNVAFIQCDEIWGQLSRSDRFRVHQAAQPRDLMSPAEFGAMLRAASGHDGSAV
jgi:hypothetical protein